jgi:hypothetical protein
MTSIAESLRRLIRRAKFSNVPDWLTERILAIPRTVDVARRDDVYYHAAAWTISYYLGRDISTPRHDGYFDSTAVNGTDFEWHSQVNRVILTGETLFLMRSMPGHMEFCRRLKHREVRPSVFEMLAAKQFFKAGFEIHAMPQKGKLGEDFDFLAKRNDQQINVEVTALTSPVYSESTLVTALKRKRSQLPDSAPAVIFCVIPESWIDTEENWKTIEGPVRKFLSGTRRINVVKIWCERRLASNEGGAGLLLMSQSFGNPTARLDIHDIDFLFTSSFSIEQGLNAMETGKDRERLIQDSNRSEFFRWVDYLLPLKL